MINKLIILLGPTGVGKTDLSIDIATSLNTEIISCDSRQFYKEMKIGTAVPSEEQLSRVKHHFIRNKSITEYYSASRFEYDFLDLTTKLFRDNEYLIMTGGSGLYIDAACGNIDDIPDVDPEVRNKYWKKYKEEGLESIRSELKMLDPAYYETADLRNHKRIIRALEIFGTTGKPYSEYLKRKGKKRDFEIIKAGLKMNRQELYSRINKRVDKMIDDGLEEEARSLIKYRNYNALNTVGYKEFFRFFDGDISREKAVELIKRNTRRYAKRQITWWSRDKEISWFHPDQKEDIMKNIQL